MPQKVSFTPDSCCDFFDKLELLSKFYELDSALNVSDLAIKSLDIEHEDMVRLRSCTVMFGTVLELRGRLLDATSGGPDNGAFGFTIEFPNVKLSSLAAMGIKLGTPAEVEYGLKATAMVHIKAFAEKLHAVPVEGEVLRVLIGTD
jgi:hypothetical protein